MLGEGLLEESDLGDAFPEKSSRTEDGCASGRQEQAASFPSPTTTANPHSQSKLTLTSTDASPFPHSISPVSLCVQVHLSAVPDLHGNSPNPELAFLDTAFLHGVRHF